MARGGTRSRLHTWQLYEVHVHGNCNTAALPASRVQLLKPMAVRQNELQHCHTDHCCSTLARTRVQVPHELCRTDEGPTNFHTSCFRTTSSCAEAHVCSIPVAATAAGCSRTRPMAYPLASTQLETPA